MESFTTFSTTADVGIRIQGTTYADLYHAALKGLLLLCFNGLPGTKQKIPPLPVYPFEFYGDSCENTLVNLLGEVIFLWQNKDQITLALDFQIAEANHIQVNFITGPLTIEPLLEIKSVTYHNLSVKESNGMMSAEIIFDI